MTSLGIAYLCATVGKRSGALLCASLSVCESLWTVQLCHCGQFSDVSGDSIPVWYCLEHRGVLLCFSSTV